MTNICHIENSTLVDSALDEMIKINDAFQNIRYKKTSEPLQNAFDLLNNIISSMTINEIDDENIIDKMSFHFTNSLIKNN